MKKALIFLFVILAGCFIIDRTGAKIMQHIHEQSNSITGFKYRYLFKECNEDLIIFGTSRCQAHYCSKTLEDSLGISVYNGGIDASDNIFSQFSTMSLTLKHHKPKYVILEVNRCDYELAEGPYSTMSFLGPYVGQNNDVDSIFKLAGTYYPYKISHLYRYNSKALSDIGGLFMHYDKLNEKGYIAKEKAPLPPAVKILNDTIRLDSIKIKYLNKFKDICASNHIRLICAISPKLIIENDSNYDFLNRWTRENDIPLIDHRNDQQFMSTPELFYDNTHLNADGSAIYSKNIAPEIRQILSLKGNVER